MTQVDGMQRSCGEACVERDSKTKKIAFFAFTIMEQGGGLENYFVNASSELSKRYAEAEISIITLSDKYSEKLVSLLSIYYRSKIDKDLLYKVKTDNIIQKLGKVNYIKKKSFSHLKRELQKYDVIYTKNEILDLLVLKGIGYKNLPPIIVGVHTPIHYPYTPSLHTKIHNQLYSGFIYKFLLRNTRFIHVLNNDAESFIRKNFKNPVKKIYNPFDMNIFYNTKELFGSHTEVYFDKNKFNIVFIARLTEQKGISDLKKIIENFAEDELFSNRIIFHICGDGNLKYIIQDLCKSTKCVNYYGFVKNTELPIILKNADLFISPSKWESLPYNILEAQAMGIPVIAYDIPGTKDIVINKKTGLLVNNIAEFVRAICDCSTGKYKFEKISENINKKFNPDKIYCELYNMFWKNMNDNSKNKDV